MRKRTTLVVIGTLWALAFLCGLAGNAFADAKVKKLIKFYKKEATVCAKYTAGLASAKERAEPYVDDAEIAADVAHLGGALAVVQDYCDAIDATLAILDPNARYKSLEVEIDRHDAVVRAGRAAAKDALDGSAPVIQRLVPKVNKRRASS